MKNNREKIIVKTSIIGIIANVLLATFKALVGLLSSSIAIVLDAINNLSDALSSIITIIGAKLSKKQPDKKHPLGHGRIEYLSTSIIAFIVLYAGISALIESIKNILNPQIPEYTTVSLIIITVAVIVKIMLGLYVKKKGEEINSDALKASGKDALFDSIISSSTLLAAIIYLLTSISLESYLGLIISLIIIKAGYEMLSDTISELLGKRIDSDISSLIKKTVLSFEEVLGVYDLVVHNYGPELLLASVHIEIDNKMTINELDLLERKITDKVLKECGVIMTGISIYSSDTNDKEANKIFSKIKEVVHKHQEVLEVHGFFMKDDNINFDMIIDFDVKNRNEIYKDIVQEIENKFPNYNFNIVLDSDISD